MIAGQIFLLPCGDFGAGVSYILSGPMMNAQRTEMNRTASATSLQESCTLSMLQRRASQPLRCTDLLGPKAIVSSYDIYILNIS